MKDLTTILEHGEDHVTEFKSGRFHNESLAKEVVAFSNSSGGSIFIGIEDDGSVSGIDDKATEECVINICRNLIEPSVLPEIFFHRHSGDKKYSKSLSPKVCSSRTKSRGRTGFMYGWALFPSNPACRN